MPESDLYLPIAPYQSGMPSLGAGHSLYRELLGNPRHAILGARHSQLCRRRAVPVRKDHIFRDYRFKGSTGVCGSVNLDRLHRLLEIAAGELTMRS